MAEYTAALIISVSVLFCAIGFVMVGCRFWMRSQLQGLRPGVDDWLILVASILVCGMTVNGILGCAQGTMGRDNEAVSAQQIYTQNEINYIQEVIEKPAYGAVKASVLFFYRRIFLTAEQFRKANNVAIILTLCWTAAFFLASVFVCGTHLVASWDSTEQKDHVCANQWALLLCFALTDVLLNVVIIWMPFPQLRKLHTLERKKYWAVVFFFMLGGIDTLVSCIRMSFIIITQTIPAFSDTVAFRQGSAPLFWTLLEVTISVIAANFPALVPLFRNRRRQGSERLPS